MKSDVYNMIRELTKSNRELRRDIEVLKAQSARQPFAGKTSYQALSYQTYQAPTIETPTITTPTINESITLVNGANNTTITKTDGSDEVTFSNDIIVNTGTFAATTVTIGDQTISEDGELLIADPVTPGIVLKDTGDLDDDAVASIYFRDSADALLSHIQWISGNMILTVANDKKVQIMGQELNFGGTAYKVEADGDATFKDITGSKAIIDNLTIDAQSITSSSYFHALSALVFIFVIVMIVM